MLYLLFTSLGSAAIKIFMRMSSGRVRGNFSLLAVSYLVTIRQVCREGMHDIHGA